MTELVDVLIEFPDTGGPFRSPGDVVDLIGTDDTIIEASYPRAEVPANQFKEILRGQPQDGQVQLYLNDPHFGPADPAQFVRGDRECFVDR